MVILSKNKTNIDIDCATKIIEPAQQKKPHRLKSIMWHVACATAVGKMHLEKGINCQDHSKYVALKDGWGIAIVSDGAGSAKHSEIGSEFLTNYGCRYFQEILEKSGWMENNKLPTEAEWINVAFYVLQTLREELKKVAVANEYELRDLGATMIVLIHSPLGFLLTHVGDGRAGYKDESGKWKAIFTPHKGEESSSTIFMTSEFWNKPYYVLSGVLVPESRVIRCVPKAFILMSDGCEKTMWQCTTKASDSMHYYDANSPHEPIINELISDLAKVKQNKLNEKLFKLLADEIPSLKKEQDDKSVIVGFK